MKIFVNYCNLLSTKKNTSDYRKRRMYDNISTLDQVF